MKYTYFDIQPTGNETIDALRVVQATANTIPNRDEQKEFIYNEIPEQAIAEIADQQFMVLGSEVVVKKMESDNGKRQYYEDGLLFVAKALKWGFIASEEAEIFDLTMDYYDPRLCGTEVIDQKAIATLVLQVPVLSIEFCSPV